MLWNPMSTALLSADVRTGRRPILVRHDPADYKAALECTDESRHQDALVYESYCDGTLATMPDPCVVSAVRSQYEVEPPNLDAWYETVYPAWWFAQGNPETPLWPTGWVPLPDGSWPYPSVMPANKIPAFDMDIATVKFRGRSCPLSVGPGGLYMRTGARHPDPGELGSDTGAIIQFPLNCYATQMVRAAEGLAEFEEKADGEETP